MNPTETYTLKFKKNWKQYAKFIVHKDYESLEKCFEQGEILLKSFPAILIQKNRKGDDTK
jgi:hypothetical protein